MSLFPKRSIEQRSDSSWFGIGADNPRTVRIDTAPKLAPVFAAIRHVVDFGSTLPVDCYRTKDDGTREQLKTLPPLLSNEDAIARQGLPQWIGQALFGLVTRGNAVGYTLDVSGYGLPSDVRWLASTAWDFDEQYRQWSVNGHPVDASRIVHIPWIVPPGRVLGLSPIEHYAAIVSAGLSAQEYADVKRGGGLPPAWLKNTKQSLLPDDASKVRDRAATAFASGKPFATGNDWDLELLTIPPNHALFIETLKLTANQIAAIYGLDPREIGGSASESLTYSTDESRSLNRANNMRPYLVRMEKAISRLLPERQFIKFNVDATIRTDIKTRTEVLGAEIADGRRSVNEARTLVDLPAVLNGDFHNVPAPSAGPVKREGEPS